VRQQLVALAVNLQRAGMSVDADPAATRGLLDEMGDDVQQALDETAALAQRIYPSQLDARGLAAALRSATVSAGRPASVDVRANAARPPEVIATLYLCCLEALEYVGAGARATVTLRDEDGAIDVEVVEDGIDSTAAETRSDAEVEGLRDRVEALGGRLTVRSEQGRGLRVSLPLSG
jgi:signal transduction histidine kinase